MSNQDVEDCKRIRLTVKGQNCYMIVGKNFIDVTVPYENRPESMELRQIISEICDAASTLLEKINNKVEE